jgi:hypothetical protein
MRQVQISSTQTEEMREMIRYVVFFCKRQIIVARCVSGIVECLSVVESRGQNYTNPDGLVKRDRPNRMATKESVMTHFTLSLSDMVALLKCLNTGFSCLDIELFSRWRWNDEGGAHEGERRSPDTRED